MYASCSSDWGAAFVRVATVLPKANTGSRSTSICVHLRLSLDGSSANVRKTLNYKQALTVDCNLVYTYSCSSSVLAPTVPPPTVLGK